ncbi:hypothetical protein TWF696_005633 [Orbilia brochopaga]|uniref:Ubiquitin 3 binding protein But2 C-terminal domain-containing protein n=1 Tax=Orbilia brochopaga TaxID=3140254 RepID=A0AAV9V806_9PEZI
MLLKSLTLGLGFASSAFAAAVDLKVRTNPKPGCNVDNCLRAVRAVQPSTRLAQASLDCASFLGLAGAFAAAAPTDIITVMETVTVPETSTITVQSTNTIEVHITSTETSGPTKTVTLTSPPPAIFTPLDRRGNAPLLPSYATGPCSVASRFTSACACIGVASPLPPPVQQLVTTVTVTETKSFVETTVAATETTVTIVDATETVRPPMVTHVVLQFKLSVEYPSSAENPTAYVKCYSLEQGSICVASQAPGDATTFYMPSWGGSIYTLGDTRLELGGEPSVITYVRQTRPGLPGDGYESVTCSIDGMNIVTCADVAPYSDTNIWGAMKVSSPSDPYDLLLTNSEFGQRLFGQTGISCYPVTLTAIPV